MNREEREAVRHSRLTFNTLYCIKSKCVKMKLLKALGNHIYNQFINSKSIEWDYYRTQVSEWERDQYMKQY